MHYLMSQIPCLSFVFKPSFSFYLLLKDKTSWCAEYFIMPAKSFGRCWEPKLWIAQDLEGFEKPQIKDL